MTVTTLSIVTMFAGPVDALTSVNDRVTALETAVSVLQKTTFTKEDAAAMRKEEKEDMAAMRKEAKEEMAAMRKEEKEDMAKMTFENRVFASITIATSLALQSLTFQRLKDMDQKDEAEKVKKEREEEAKKASKSLRNDLINVLTYIFPKR